MILGEKNGLAAACVLAIGIALGAWLLGTQVKHIGGGRQAISVKGLAEKPVKADLAEWTVTTEAVGATFADALAKLRAEQPKVRAFFAAQGFDASVVKDGDESVRPHMVEQEKPNGDVRYVQKGFEASQSLTVATPDLAKIESANKAILQFQAEGAPVKHGRPMFMISNLEEVKMSLIGAATQNALVRATEFAKNGNAKVGAMRSASQGAFYILPAGASDDVDDYGGRYDKSTIDKIARVVVTIEYNIEK
jgi:hypothetical protein